MKKSTVWLMVAIGSVIALMTIGCCTFAALSDAPSSSYGGSAAATAEIDLEKLTKEFETHVTSGSQDLNGFEQAVNDKGKNIYHGTDHVDVTMKADGGVIGYVNKDADPTYAEGADEKVFELQVEQQEKRVVAHDRHHHYYSHNPMGGFFTGYLVGNMLSSQRSYYPAGSYYRAPSTATYQKPGYFNRVRSSPSSSSFRSGSRSTSSFGSGSRSRSSSGSGGFGFGK